MEGATQMTTRLTFKERKCDRSVILPVVAKAAIVALPLVSVLPSLAQTAAQGEIISVRVYRPTQDTAKKNMTSATAAVASSLAAKGSSKGATDTENVVAKDTYILSSASNGLVKLMQIKKAATVKIGDVIARVQIEYLSESAGYFTSGFKVTGIDAGGITIAPNFKSGIFRSEQSSVDYPKDGVRIDYGKERTMDCFPGLTYRHQWLPITIKAEAGRTPGTASVTAIFSKAGIDTAKAALEKYATGPESAPISGMNTDDTAGTKAKK
jgi:pyrimidine operon attenuation protein/uracil phosphoribosyltransferase